MAERLASGGREGARYSLAASVLLVAPLVILLAGAFIAPLVKIIADSAHLHVIADMAGDELIRKVFVRTLVLSAVVTAGVLAIAYPTALLIWNARGRWRGVMLALVLFPLFTSLVVRNYAWTAVLDRNGVINNLLLDAGVISQPLRLMRTNFAVCIGMVHALLPLAILPIYGWLRGLDDALIRASASLGASRFKTFQRVTLPLSLPGAVVAGILVFILSLGFYVTPAILGGPNSLMVSNLIDKRINVNLDFTQASIMATALLLLVIAMLGLASRVFSFNRILRETHA